MAGVRRGTSWEEAYGRERYQKHVTLASGDRRTIIVGDVHGCAGLLRELLEDRICVDFDRDIIILAGDLVSKGPDSIGVVQYAMDKGMRSVKGNHDLHALKAAKAWRKHGVEPKAALRYVMDLSEEQLAWMAAQPYTIMDTDKNFLVVHAGLVPDKSLSKQSEKDMTTMRNLVRLTTPNPSPGQPPLVAIDSVDEGEPWASLWTGARSGIHVFFGHDSKRGLQLWPHATGLDTRACKGVSLTAAIMPGRMIVSHPPLAPTAYFANATMAHAVAVPVGRQKGVAAQAQQIAVIWDDGMEEKPQRCSVFSGCVGSFLRLLGSLQRGLGWGGRSGYEEV